MVDDALPTEMKVFLALFAVLFCTVVVFIITSTVRNARVLRKAGLDPLTAQSQLAARAGRSQLLSPHRSLEERLAELDDLRERGVITAEEHAAARARALGGA